MRLEVTRTPLLHDHVLGGTQSRTVPVAIRQQPYRRAFDAAVDELADRGEMPPGILRRG